ncbi:MAG: hypothetical protein ACI358_03285 [Candidatus Limimorpha sp.]
MIARHLKYRLKAKGKYHLHSPLVYDFYEKVFSGQDEGKPLKSFGHFNESFYIELDNRIKKFVTDNPLVFNNNDTIIVVKGNHSDKNKEYDWHRLIENDKVRLSIDCWHFGIVFVMNRLKKENYILKI